MEASDDVLKIGVDLDGTISEYPVFFKLFTKAMARLGCKIYVITDRVPGTEPQVQGELEGFGITYDVLKITGSKAEYILEEGIDVLFDDTDRYFFDLPEEVAVFKIRQKYNFDFGRGTWYV
jgi:hypothetical protein